ncbi:MAG: ComF family protein [Desulfobulbaceae bacterium]|nr:ComF family protein [Desulfobulbaceae bacterium]
MPSPAIRLTQLFTDLRIALAELLFPSSCLACQGQVPPGTLPMFCPECLAQIELVSGPLCPGCGRQFPKAAGGAHYCGLCLSGHYHFERARAVALYTEPFSHVIHRFKYRGKTHGLPSFSALLARLPEPPLREPPELILPVPLHDRKLRQRGFNQAVLLARAFFPRDRQRIKTDLLLRQLNTDPQTSLSGQARRQNLKNAFKVRKPEQVRGKMIVLVDDVFTTGTTVNECARVLKKAGARRVEVLTLARVRE